MKIVINAWKLQHRFEDKLGEINSKHNILNELANLTFIILLMASIVLLVNFTFIQPTNILTTNRISVIFNPLHMFGVTLIVLIMIFLGKTSFYSSFRENVLWR